MSVRVETTDLVTTIILDRPERRNAVDGATAQALADAFRAFERDERARVAVLWGTGDTLAAALAREYELGRATNDSGESQTGASRFAAGAGRHGAPAP